MASITKIWVNEDLLYVETDDGGDLAHYIIDPDQHYLDTLDESNDEKPSGTLVWTKPEDAS